MRVGESAGCWAGPGGVPGGPCGPVDDAPRLTSLSGVSRPSVLVGCDDGSTVTGVVTVVWSVWPFGAPGRSPPGCDGSAPPPAPPWPG